MSNGVKSLDAKPSVIQDKNKWRRIIIAMAVILFPLTLIILFFKFLYNKEGTVAEDWTSEKDLLKEITKYQNNGIPRVTKNNS